MALTFPRRDDDIRLTKSPLVEVICQVRFPAILSIPAKRPIAFQEKIRKRFPDFETEDSVRFEIDATSGMPSGTQSVSRNFRFGSRKRGSSVVLAEDFFALSTTKYVVWEHFADDLELVAASVNDAFEPSHATRVGLRYINVLNPENLGLSTLAGVVDLLQPALASLYRTEVWDEPAGMIVLLTLEDDSGNLNLRLGLREDEGRRSVQLDFDYFEQDPEGLPITDLVQRSERYHRVIYDAFRWSIKDEKLAIFEPVAKREALT